MTDDTVPKDALRELVAEWREEADELIHEVATDDGVHTEYVEGRGAELIVAANELEAVLDDD